MSAGSGASARLRDAGVGLAPHVENLGLVGGVAQQGVAEAVGVASGSPGSMTLVSRIRSCSATMASSPTTAETVSASKVGPTVAATWTTRRSTPGALSRHVNSSWSRSGMASVRSSSRRTRQLLDEEGDAVGLLDDGGTLFPREVLRREVVDKPLAAGPSRRPSSKTRTESLQG